MRGEKVGDFKGIVRDMDERGKSGRGGEVILV